MVDCQAHTHFRFYLVTIPYHHPQVGRVEYLTQVNFYCSAGAFVNKLNSEEPSYTCADKGLAFSGESVLNSPEITMLLL